MKGEKYLDTLRASIKAIEHWKEHGNAIIADCGAMSLVRVIEESMNKLYQLDADEVKDEILEREDGIAWKIKRINKYGLLPLLEYIEGNKDYMADLNDDAVNDAINKYWNMVYFKADELCREMAIAERYLPSPKHPLVEKALNSPELLRIFKYDRSTLEEYILYCHNADTPTAMAKRAAELFLTKKKNKEGEMERLIERDDLNSVLHQELEKIGLQVGTIKLWQGATRKKRNEHGDMY